MSLFSKFRRNQKKFNDLKFQREEPEKSEIDINTKEDLKLLQKDLENKQEELELRGKIIEDIHKQFRTILLN